MGKNYLIDSNAVIDYLDNELPDYGMLFLSAIVDEIPNISVITKIEVLRFNSSAHTNAILEDFVRESNMFDLDHTVVDQTIAICGAKKIKLPDAIIAATALTYGLILITRNVADFKDIEDLILLNPWDYKAVMS